VHGTGAAPPSFGTGSGANRNHDRNGGNTRSGLDGVAHGVRRGWLFDQCHDTNGNEFCSNPNDSRNRHHHPNRGHDNRNYDDVRPGGRSDDNK
jgi:hypothetical protein